MKCRRPNCGNTGSPARRGLCSKHRHLELLQSGRPMGYADVQPVADHLTRLLRAGLSVSCISRCSGMSAFAIYLILQGKREKVRAATAANLFAVKPSDVLRSEDGAHIPSVGTVRRLRALHAIGYTGTDLATRLDFSSTTVRELLAGEKPLVRASTARSVAALFNALEVNPRSRSGSTSRAINRAKRLGWPVPFSWDGDTIDDPGARPCVPQLTVDDWLPEYEKLRAKGYHKRKIAALMGIEATSLNSRLRRAKAA